MNVLTIPVLATAILTISLIFAPALIHRAYRAPRVRECGSPAHRGLPFGEVRIPTVNGKTLFGWLDPFTGNVIERVSDAVVDHTFGNGLIYAVDGGGVYTIDPNTKTRTAISSLSSTTIDFVSFVPLPATAWLLGSAIIGAGIAARRKKKA